MNVYVRKRDFAAQKDLTFRYLIRNICDFYRRNGRTLYRNCDFELRRNFASASVISVYIFNRKVRVSCAYVFLVYFFSRKFTKKL